MNTSGAIKPAVPRARHHVTRAVPQPGCDAEVDDHCAGARHHDVAWLDVPMDNALGVQVVERLACLVRALEDVAHG